MKKFFGVLILLAVVPLWAAIGAMITFAVAVAAITFCGVYLYSAKGTK